MATILHVDWSIRLGENTCDQTLKHVVAMLLNIIYEKFYAILFYCGLTESNCVLKNH